MRDDTSDNTSFGGLSADSTDIAEASKTDLINGTNNNNGTVLEDTKLHRIHKIQHMHYILPCNPDTFGFEELDCSYYLLA